MSGLRYTIGELSARTRVSTHTIRAWEKRYNAISPERTDSNQRVYSESQLARLMLIKQAVDAKHPISRVATLPDEELRNLAQSSLSDLVTPQNATSDREYIRVALFAIERLDEEDLSHCLRRAAASYGLEEMLDGILLPLLSEIGIRWENGTLRIFQEHMATSAIRTFLADQLATINPRSGSARLIVTTPQNQNHELGALLVAIAAAIQNWNVIYLGPNLPSLEIAEAAAKTGADAIALSLVYPKSDPALRGELASLRRLVGESTPIFVGGAAVDSYADALNSIQANILATWRDLGPGLKKLAS